MFQSIQPLGLHLTLVAPFLVLSTLPVPSPAAPCTTFCLPGTDGPVFGRNYDWSIGVGHVTVNKRGLAKTALVHPPAEPARWTSKYGSLTFNQYGREFPMGGMNEAGLVVEVMWLTDTVFPATDRRAGLRELQWVQYQLDNCRTVEEVIATDKTVRITPNSISIHFLLCDRSGQQATVEFLNGKMTAHLGGDLPIPALTNDSYSDSMEYLETFDGFGGDRPTPSSASSLDRFVKAACGVVDYEPGSAEESAKYAFGLLADVSQGDYTKWSIVYDLQALTVHFKTLAAPAIKTVELGKFDLSAATPCRILNIDTAKAGDAAERFVDYSTKANWKLVRESWAGTDFLADTPDERLREVSLYPESVVVASGGEGGSRGE